MTYRSMATELPLGVYFFLTFMTLVSHVHLLVPPKTPVLSGFGLAAIGSHRELVCDADQPGAGTITYKWYKCLTNRDCTCSGDWESTRPIGTGQRYIFNPVTEKRVFHQGGLPTYVIGKYVCRASNSAGTRHSESGNLFVYKPCSLYTVSVSPPKPAVGSTFTVNCYIPNPGGYTVRWAKRNDASSASYSTIARVHHRYGCLPPYVISRYSWSSCSSTSTTSKTFNIQVTNAQTSDSGYWICEDYDFSCRSKPLQVVVQVPPGTPQITGFPSGPVLVGPVLVGTQLNLLNLKCDASPPGDTYDWYKDNTKLSSSLTYDFLVKKESAGVYKCVATNGVGSANSSDNTLTVYYKLDSVVVSSGKTSSHVGEKDKFTCTATGGNPTPTLKIYFKRSGGTPVEVTQGQERVMAKEDNQAEYYCEATVPGYSAWTMRSSSKTYNVTFPNTKVSFTNNPTAAVQVGQVKTFRCETDESNPISSIKWFKYIGSSWRDITTGISPSERNGAYGGKIRISDVATKVMNDAEIRCSSKYDLTGHEFTSQADTTMNLKFAPNTTLVYVKRHGTKMTARWVPLHHSDTTSQIINYCRIDGLNICGYHVLTNQTAGETSFVIEGSAMANSVLFVYLEVFDGPHLVFRSKPVLESKEGGTYMYIWQRDGVGGTNVGMIVGIVIVILVVMAVIVAVVILHRRNMACFSGSKKEQSGPALSSSTANKMEPIYVNINPAFEAGENRPGTTRGENEAHDLNLGNKEPEYMNVRAVDRGNYAEPDIKENPYAELNITADVIAAQTYSDLRH